MNTLTPGLPPVFSLSGVLIPLEQQIARLDALVRNVAAARTTLPLGDAGVWTGPAHSVYVTALDALVVEVDAAHSSLSSALRDSRRAHAALLALVPDA